MLEMLLCACLWSIAGIFIKMIDWHPMAIACARSFFAGTTTVVYIIIRRFRIRINKSVVVNALFIASTYMCFVGANKLTTSANAIVLQFTSPVFVIVISALFLKKKFTKLDIVTVALTLAGISIFVAEGIGGGRLIGDMLGLLAGLFIALMFVFIGPLPVEERMSGLVLGHAFTVLAGLPFVFITHPVFSSQAVICAAVLGVFQLGIPYILLATATENCPPLACSLISVAEPLLNPVWVAIFAHEYPSPVSLIGAVIVLVTVTVYCVLSGRRSAGNPEKS